MTIRLLTSGYWHARWPGGFAQWRVGSYPAREDFFQPEWTYSESRAAELNRRAALAATQEGKP